MVRQVRHLCRARPGGEDHELVASVSRHDVLDPDGALHPGRDDAERPVSCEVTAAVVDLFQRVDVDHQEARLCPAAASVRDLGDESVAEVLAIEEVGEGVLDRCLVELTKERLLAGVDQREADAVRPHLHDLALVERRRPHLLGPDERAVGRIGMLDADPAVPVPREAGVSPADVRVVDGQVSVGAAPDDESRWGRW